MKMSISVWPQSQMEGKREECGGCFGWHEQLLTEKRLTHSVLLFARPQTSGSTETGSMSSNVSSGAAKSKPLSPFRKRGSLQYTASTGEWRGMLGILDSITERLLFCVVVVEPLWQWNTFKYVHNLLIDCTASQQDCSSCLPVILLHTSLSSCMHTAITYVLKSLSFCVVSVTWFPFLVVI